MRRARQALPVPGLVAYGQAGEAPAMTPMAAMRVPRRGTLRGRRARRWIITIAAIVVAR